ncbi:porin family protein [Maribacter algarum]|uniref:Porin family protein n=1 Tax=Maribacter algarum (ex Zhang et al. 2020) TaxID=2578118 RepID=A0A5S3PE52_9FLAO|nr:outer membrane beta-barrel protein [Maribacter algarum]TMM52157.1 porin family protein [Maribacter algarum]
MKKLALVLVLLFVGSNILAQDSKLSATLSYPLTIGDNFLNDYTGYIDVGLQYSFVNLEVVRFGVSANASFIGIPNPGIEGEKYSGTLIYPRVFGEFLLGRDGTFRPIAGLGYGINKFNSTLDTTGAGFDTIKRNYEGLILNIGASYDITSSIFVIAQYDWANIDRSSSFVNNENFNNRGSLVKVGVGVRF